MTDDDKYGPWIAFNGGPKPVADDVKVQVHLLNETRAQAEKSDTRADWKWDVPREKNHAIIAYRVLREPDTVTMWGNFKLETAAFSRSKLSGDKLRITFQTIDGKPDWTTAKIEEIDE